MNQWPTERQISNDSFRETIFEVSFKVCNISEHFLLQIIHIAVIRCSFS